MLVNNEASLIAELLCKSVNKTSSPKAAAAILTLATCWPCLAMGLHEAGTIYKHAKEQRCWPVSVEFCIRMAISDIDLMWQVVEDIEDAFKRNPGPHQWCLSAIIEQFNRVWIGERAFVDQDIKTALSQLLTDGDHELVAERMFGALDMSTWLTEMEPFWGVHIERKIKSLEPKQLAHLHWDTDLQLVSQLGMLDLDAVIDMGEHAKAFLLARDLGL